MSINSFRKSKVVIGLLSMTCGLIFASASHAALMITDIDGSTPPGNLYTYTNGPSMDRLGIPNVGIDGGFWNITTSSSNQLLFETIIDVGQSSAVLTLSGLEANDDWISAVIEGVGSPAPTLEYAGGDTATLTFFNGSGYWLTGDSFTITFATTDEQTVPEPATLVLMGLGLAGLAMSRRKQIF